MSKLANRIKLLRALEDFERGKISSMELEEIKAECSGKPMKLAPVPESHVTPPDGFKPHQSAPLLDDEVKSYISQLKANLKAVFEEKNALCKKNVSTPPHVNTKELVDQIMDKRQQVVELKDAIFKAETTGKIPQKKEPETLDESFQDQLPNDKFQLDRMIKNIKINIKKDSDKAATVKTDVIRNMYLQKVAVNRKKLELMLAKFSRL